MKAEQAKKLADESLANLATALELGQSDAMKTFLAAMSRFHPYSFGNIMLIASQKSDATRVAGFQTWKTLGRFVKQGEKGIVIIAPMVIRRRTRMHGHSTQTTTAPFYAFVPCTCSTFRKQTASRFPNPLP